MENLRERMTQRFQLFEKHLPEWRELIRPLEAKMNNIEGILSECERLKENIRNIHYDGQNQMYSEEKVQEKPTEKKPEIENEEEEEEKETDEKRMCAPLTSQEFGTIPKYMIGRFTLDSMNEIIGTIDAFLMKKHQLTTKPPKTWTKQERDQVLAWRELEAKATKLSTGLFFVESDIRPLLQDKLRATFAKSIPCLRHVRRIREQRCGPLTFYHT